MLDRPQEQSPPAIGDIIMPQAQITEAASVNTPEAAPITAEQAAKGAQDALAKALEHMTPVEAPQSQSESRPSGIRTNFQVRRQAPTNAAGQAPLQYYKMNDFGRWEPISQAAYQALEAQYKGNPELMGKIQARRGNR